MFLIRSLVNMYGLAVMCAELRVAGITDVWYEWLRLNPCPASNTRFVCVRVASGCQVASPWGHFHLVFRLSRVISPLCGSLHLTLCTFERDCVCLWVLFFPHVFHVCLLQCHTSYLNLCVQLSHSDSHSHTWLSTVLRTLVDKNAFPN